MVAYMVHDEKKEADLFILPNAGCAIQATAAWFERFISPKPDFSRWTGDACGDLAPEDFGTVVAIREQGGDVRIVDENLWRRRMEFYSTGG